MLFSHRELIKMVSIVLLLHCLPSIVVLISFSCILVPSSIPTFLQATPLSPTILSITWEYPVFINQNGIITLYTLTYQGIERDTQLRTVTLPQTNQSLTCHNLDSLDEYTTYNITLSASTSVGAGTVTNVLVTTDEHSKFLISCFTLSSYPYCFPLIVPSSAPNNLTTSSINSTSILVSWDAPNMTHWNGILLSYTLYYYGQELDTSLRTVNIQIQGSNHSNQEYTIGELQEYTHYRVVVNSVTSIGSGSAANSTVRTLQAGSLTSC